MFMPHAPLRSLSWREGAPIAQSPHAPHSVDHSRTFHTFFFFALIFGTAPGAECALRFFSRLRWVACTVSLMPAALRIARGTCVCFWIRLTSGMYLNLSTSPGRSGDRCPEAARSHESNMTGGTPSGTFAPPLEVVCVMVERSLEVHSSLSSSAAMDSPHACTTPARSGPTRRAGRSMHGIHRGTMVGA